MVFSIRLCYYFTFEPEGWSYAAMPSTLSYMLKLNMVYGIRVWYFTFEPDRWAYTAIASALFHIRSINMVYSIRLCYFTFKSEGWAYTAMTSALFYMRKFNMAYSIRVCYSFTFEPEGWAHYFIWTKLPWYTVWVNAILPFSQRGDRILPWRARPVPFCGQGFLPPPLISARVGALS